MQEGINGPKTMSLLEEVMVGKEDVPTNQGSANDEKEPPFDMEKAKKLMLLSPHHSTCVLTRTAATVGLGFITDEERTAREKVRKGDVTAKASLLSMDGISRVSEVLNPLCDGTFREVLWCYGQDYVELANGCMEVVRQKGRSNGKILALNHIPAENCRVVISLDEDTGVMHKHYRVQADDGGAERIFAKYGDRDWFMRNVTDADDEKNVSEVIHQRCPSSHDRWYGVPGHLSGVASIDLWGCLHQHKYDFFLNRGVPEFMLFIKGQKLSEDQWKVVEDGIKANIGLGNSHKSFALNLENKEIEIDVVKLAMEDGGEDAFVAMGETLAVSIVTAHRVPPLLAGILIPGKLGATNELPNALQAFQALVCGQDQGIISEGLGTTLGNPKKNGGLKLKPEDFAFRRITEQFDLGAMDTIARMRQTVPEANAEGRNVKAGLKKHEDGSVGLASSVLVIAEQRGHGELASMCRRFLEAA